MGRKKLSSGEAHPDHNNGRDTAENDLVMHEGDILENHARYRRYRVQSLLGSGTFGQVVLCTCIETGEEVAVKVIKNQQAYYNQALFETHVLKLLNDKFDPDGDKHVVRMLGNFVHAKHLCIVFERLHANLYEVLKFNGYNGLSLNLVCVMTKQILECLCETRKANIIHCDLKPENVLLEDALGTSCKVIDFGSACFEERTVYSYIQSRFYRSPEVLLGASRYTSRVDMWSLGCLAAELFLGLPLYPGVSDYDMLRRVTESVGAPAPDFLRTCKLANQFFTLQRTQGSQQATVRLMTTAEHQTATGKPAAVGRMYFRHLSALPPGADVTLTDVIMRYPLDSKLSRAQAEVERTRRYCFLSFLKGILQTDPTRRWTPWQALQHPFITDKPFTDSFEPPEEPPEVRPMLRHSSMPRAVPADHRSAMTAGHVGSAQHAAASPHTLSPYQHVQVSPFQAATATNGAFAMSVSGSDSLPRAYVASAEARGYGSDSGGILDRSGTIPASAFPMLGSSVGLGNTSTLSMFQENSSSLSGSVMNNGSPIAQGRRRGEIGGSYSGSRCRRSSVSSEMWSGLSPGFEGGRQVPAAMQAGGAAQHGTASVPASAAGYPVHVSATDAYWSGSISGTMTDSVDGSGMLCMDGVHTSFRHEHGRRARRHSGSTDAYGRPAHVVTAAALDPRPARQSDSWDPFFRESDAELLGDGDRALSQHNGWSHAVSEGSPAVSGGLQHIYRYLDADEGGIAGGDHRGVFMTCVPRWQRQSALTMPARIGEDGSMDSSGAVSEASGPRGRQPCLSVPGSSMGADRWGPPGAGPEWGNVEDVSEELPTDATVSNTIGGGDAFMDSLLLLPESAVNAHRMR
eukprot:jgi/Ulvmu1/3068/UM015_0108.1